MSELNSKIPTGPLAEKWDNYKEHAKLVNPANKRKLEVIVVGTGLAGASAAASLAELGYQVKAFCFQDSPRRAHSIAAQGGINAAKNYKNDGDSVCGRIEPLLCVFATRPWQLSADIAAGGTASALRKACILDWTSQEQFARRPGNAPEEPASRSPRSPPGQ